MDYRLFCFIGVGFVEFENSKILTMIVESIEPYICICHNKYGIVTRPFSSNQMPPVNKYKEIAVGLGIWQDEDEILIHRLDDIKNVFIWPEA